MASGSMGRVDQNGFDLVSDDVLCSYEEYGSDNRNDSNGVVATDLSIGVNGKDLNTTQMSMSMSKSSKPPSASYSPSEESCLNHDIINAVENTMKRSTDNMMRFLEGISSRLSQLELYCYNIDKSVGQMRSNFDRDHDETDLNLKSVQKHIQEVHRSVQIMRDKQELAETEKELVKLQVAQMKSSPASSVQQDEDRSTPRETNMNGQQQLALALPQSPLPSRPVEQPSLGPAPPMQGYYLSQPQMTTVLVSNQPLNAQYMPSNSPYHASQGNQTSQHQSMSGYQQWSQQVQQPHIKVSSPSAYPSYLPNSATMQPQYLGASAHANPHQVMAYGTPVQDQPQPTQHHPKTSDGYTLAPVNTYIIYDGEGGRVSHLSQGGYSQVMMPVQNPQPTPGPVRPPQFVRNHPYNELIDKLANMGYRGEHVLGAIQRLEESGQPVDFNAVIDKLSGNSSGSSQRGWSG